MTKYVLSDDMLRQGVIHDLDIRSMTNHAEKLLGENPAIQWPELRAVVELVVQETMQRTLGWMRDNELSRDRPVGGAYENVIIAHTNDLYMPEYKLRWLETTAGKKYPPREFNKGRRGRVQGRRR